MPLVRAWIAILPLLSGFHQGHRSVVVLTAPRAEADSATSAALAVTLAQLRQALGSDSLFSAVDEQARADSTLLAAQGRRPFPLPARYWCSARAMPDASGKVRIHLTCFSTETGRPVTTIDRPLRRDFAASAAFLASRAVRALRSDVTGEP